MLRTLHEYNMMKDMCAGIVMKMDGSYESVAIPSTMDGCFKWFEERTGKFCEIQDIQVREVRPGVLEYITVLYDVQANEELMDSKGEVNEDTDGHNAWKPTQDPYLVTGDMLVFKTHVSSNSFDDMTDTVLRDPPDYDDVINSITAFREDLSIFLPPEAQHFLFPVVRASLIKETKTLRSELGDIEYYVFCEDNLPVDLLTKGMKYRQVFDFETYDTKMRFSKISPRFMIKNNADIHKF